MTALQRLSKFLQDAIAQDGEKSVETLAGYIVGELIGDYDNVYTELMKSNPDVKRIGDLASDLEWTNGSKQELEDIWTELKQLSINLK